MGRRLQCPAVLRTTASPRRSSWSGCEVEGLNETVGPADQVTIVALGKLKAAGRVRASLVAAGAVELAPDSQIRGNLILTSDAPKLAGLVMYDERLSAGPDGDTSPGALRHVHANIAPGAALRLASR